MRPLLKDVEGLGRQGDSAIAIDLNGDAKNEFLVPFDCSAVGNCLCAVIDSSKRVIGQLNGKVFAIEPLRDRWSTIFAYHHMSAGSGAVTVYEFKSNRYEEVESGDEIEGKPVARFLRCEKNPKCRIRTNPVGNTCRKKRRRNSSKARRISRFLLWCAESRQRNTTSPFSSPTRR